MPQRHLAQPVEMLLDQLERVEVADPLVERGRSLDVGEQQGDVADRQTLGTADDLGAEQVPEGLAGQQMLAGQVGIEAQERILGSRADLETARTARSLVAFVDLERDGPAGQLDLGRDRSRAEEGQPNPLRLGSARLGDAQQEARHRCRS